MIPTIDPTSGLANVLYILGMTMVVLWGKHRFMTKPDCQNEQKQCSTAICKKIDELKQGQITVFKYIQKTERTLGRIEQYMDDHNNREG